MSDVIVKMKGTVEPDNNIDDIKDDIRASLPGVASLMSLEDDENDESSQFKIEDGPFGIKELLFVVKIPDGEGGTSPVEKKLDEEVEQDVRFEVVSVTR